MLAKYLDIPKFQLTFGRFNLNLILGPALSSKISTDDL